MEHGGGLLQPAMHNKVPLPREGLPISVPFCLQLGRRSILHDLFLKLICIHSSMKHKVAQDSTGQQHQ